MRMSEVSYTMDLQKPSWTKATYADLSDLGMAMEFIKVKQLLTTDSKKKKPSPPLWDPFWSHNTASSLNDKGNPGEVDVGTI